MLAFRSELSAAKDNMRAMSLQISAFGGDSGTPENQTIMRLLGDEQLRLSRLISLANRALTGLGDWPSTVDDDARAVADRAARELGGRVIEESPD